MSLHPTVDLDLRNLILELDQRAGNAAFEVDANWSEVLGSLYADLTALMEQHRNPSAGPGEKTWNSLVAEFPYLAPHTGLRDFFIGHWFTYFSVNFQFRMQDPEVTPLLMGKLFTEIREREGDRQCIDAQRLMACLQAGIEGIHKRFDHVDHELKGIRSLLERQQPVRPPEKVIGLMNTHQRILGRDVLAREVIGVLRAPGPSVVSITAPPGFGKSALFARAVALAMPNGEPEEAGLAGLAVLDARQEQPTIMVLASLLARLTGWQESDKLRSDFFDALRQAGPLWIVIENAEQALLPRQNSAFCEVLKGWCANQHTSKLILLSRHTFSPAPPCHLRLRNVEQALRGGLAPSDATALMRIRLRETRFAATPEALLLEIADRLHRIPMALVQFAGYLVANESGISLDERFLRGNDLLRKFDPDNMEGSIGQMVEEHLQLLGPEARRLLGLVVWSGVTVPQSGLLAVAGDSGAALLTRLARSGLLDEIEGKPAEGMRFGMHPLLRALVASGVPGEVEARAWMVAAASEHEQARHGPVSSLWTLTERVYRTSVEDQGRSELANDLAMAIMNKGVALDSLGRLEAAVAAYDEAISIRRKLVEEQGRSELANDLAAAIMNKGVALANLGRLEEAVTAFEEAIQIQRPLVEAEWRAELASDLATPIMNKGIALTSLGRVAAGVEAYDEAIQILRLLVEEQGRAQHVDDLARAIMNRGIALKNLGRLEAAVAAYEEAILILRPLVEDQGRTELANDLAATITNKGVAFRNLGRLEEAVAAYEEAIRIWRPLVNDQGRTELANELATAIMNKGIALANLGRLEKAVAAFDLAIQIWRTLVEEQGRSQLVNHLAMALFNLAFACKSMKAPMARETALAAAREAREIWTKLVNEGWNHLAGNLEKARELEAVLLAQGSP